MMYPIKKEIILSHSEKTTTSSPFVICVVLFNVSNGITMRHISDRFDSRLYFRWVSYDSRDANVLTPHDVNGTIIRNPIRKNNMA